MRMEQGVWKLELMELSDQVDERKKKKEKVSVDFQVCSLYGGWW